MKRKTHNDVWGFSHCPNYDECAICYGCRAYDPGYYKCKNCSKNKKLNVCNRKLHTAKILSKMIRRPRIEI